MSTRDLRPYAKAFALRALWLSLLWLALTNGDLRSWWIGLVGVLAATLASLAMLPPDRLHLRWRGLPALLAFFFREMFLGGVDVARRAFDPRRNVQPRLVEYDTRLNPASAVLLADIASLLPGTLVAELGEDRLLIHILDRDISGTEKVRELEARIEAVAQVR